MRSTRRKPLSRKNSISACEGDPSNAAFGGGPNIMLVIARMLAIVNGGFKSEGQDIRDATRICDPAIDRRLGRYRAEVEKVDILAAHLAHEKRRFTAAEFAHRSGTHRVEASRLALVNPLNVHNIC